MAGDKALLRRVIREFEGEMLEALQDQVNDAHDRIHAASTGKDMIYQKGVTDGMALLWAWLKDTSELDTTPEE